jgi:hypothetical protein
MIFYHHGAVVQPSAVRVGNAFVARALIHSKGGEIDSLWNSAYLRIEV